MNGGTVASDRYTPQQFADMARRLEECIEVSALCMSLALAGERQRRALAEGRLAGPEGALEGAGSARTGDDSFGHLKF